LDSVVELTTHGGSAGAATAVNDAAFASAFAALASGGYLVLPLGAIDIGVPISLPANVSLIGSGRATIIRAGAAITGGLVEITGTPLAYKEGHRIENLSLYGADLATYGIKLDCAIYSNVIRNVRIRDCSGAGILTVAQLENFTGGCWGNTIDNAQIFYCGRGIHLGQSSNLTRILNSNIKECTGIGIYGETSTAVNVIGTSIEKNGTAGVEEVGIKVVGGTVWNISGCYFEANGVGAGVDIETAANALIPYHVDGLTVQGCYFNGLETFSGGEVTVPAKSAHALRVAGGAVAVLGGYSWRHSGTAFSAGVDGTITNYGLVCEDRLGLTA